MRGGDGRGARVALRPDRTARAAVALAALLLGGCSAGGDPTPPGDPSPSSSVRTYVSLGDSYAAGFEPDASGNGFAEQAVEQARVQHDLTLELHGFGCSGISAQELAERRRCDELTPAVEVLRGAAGERPLVSMVVGGGEVLTCARTGARGAALEACVAERMPALRGHLEAVLAEVHAAAPDAQVVGFGYPDVLLGELALPDGDRELGEDSVALFRDHLGPALRKAYTDAGGTYVDVTAESGAYGSLDEETELPELGTVPYPAAVICRYTHYCESRDVHPDAQGYAYYARRLVEQAVEPSTQGQGPA